MMATARRAIHQLLLQFWIALPLRHSPMAMMMGPVTMGGKNFITLVAPKILNRPASTKYISPAQKIPTQA